MLPLTFADPSDYDKIDPSDRVTIEGLEAFAPGKPFTLVVSRPGGGRGGRAGGAWGEGHT
jgi:aconitate hydratase